MRSLLGRTGEIEDVDRVCGFSVMLSREPLKISFLDPTHTLYHLFCPVSTPKTLRGYSIENTIGNPVVLWIQGKTKG
jgi:hypothetical protein